MKRSVAMLMLAGVLAFFAPAARAAQFQATPEMTAVLASMNTVRGSARLRALLLEPRLCAIARGYAADMARRNYFGHISPEGLSPFQRMTNAHYLYRYAGENLVRDLSAVRGERLLAHDPAHRAVMLSPNFGRVGIGVVHARSGVIVVEDFSD